MKKIIYIMMITTMLVFTSCEGIEPFEPTDPMELGVKKVEKLLECKVGKKNSSSEYSIYKEEWKIKEFKGYLNGKEFHIQRFDDLSYFTMVDGYQIYDAGFAKNKYIIYEEKGDIIMEVDDMWRYKIVSISKDELVLSVMLSKAGQSYYDDIANWNVLTHYERSNNLVDDYGVDIYWEAPYKYNGERHWFYYYKKDNKVIPFVYEYDKVMYDTHIFKYKKYKIND